MRVWRRRSPVKGKGTPMQLIVYIDPPDLATASVDWTGETDNMISHTGDASRWSASDVERVRDQVVQWLLAHPQRTTTIATRVPVTEKSAPRRYRDGSVAEATLKVGVQMGRTRAWVEIAGLRSEVIDQVLGSRPQDRATL